MFSITESKDIPLIHITNFLPVPVIDEFYAMMRTLRPRFGEPAWSSPAAGTVTDSQAKRALCHGTDIWFPVAETPAETPWMPDVLYELLERYMFHQGILDFCRFADQEVFRLLPLQSPNGKMHVITYGNGGYYGWHRDHSLPGGAFVYGNSPPRHNLFTFSLCLCSSKSMTGGDLLFQRDNRTVQMPFLHNSLTIVPSSVNHAATVVTMDDDDDWIHRRISCQFWMAGAQTLPLSAITDEKRWRRPA